MYRLRTNVNPSVPNPRTATGLTSQLSQTNGGGSGDGFGKKAPLDIAKVSAGSHEEGDIIYGAWEISTFIFGATDNPCRARRRVFNLAAHYKARKENAGFFKLNGALCLSKKQWRHFHGLS